MSALVSIYENMQYLIEMNCIYVLPIEEIKPDQPPSTLSYTKTNPLISTLIESIVKHHFYVEEDVLHIIVVSSRS